MYMCSECWEKEKYRELYRSGKKMRQYEFKMSLQAWLICASFFTGRQEVLAKRMISR